MVYPATLDTRVQIAEDLEEMRSQLHKQVNRLRELRVKKEEEPGMCLKYHVERVLTILRWQMHFMVSKTIQHCIV